MTVHLNIVTIQPLLALIFGVLILMMPRLLNYLIAVYLIVVGITGVWPHLVRRSPRSVGTRGFEDVHDRHRSPGCRNLLDRRPRRPGGTLVKAPVLVEFPVDVLQGPEMAPKQEEP